jgi:hypothetical protein
VFFEEFIKQHRVHSLIAHSVSFSISVETLADRVDPLFRQGRKARGGFEQIIDDSCTLL